MIPAAAPGRFGETAAPWIVDARTRFKARLLRARGDDAGDLPIAVDLTRPDLFAACALHGWSAPEAHGAWSVGPVAQLLLVPRVPPGAAATLGIEVTSASTAPGPSVQTVDVDVNGMVAARWTLGPEPPPVKFALRVPPEALLALGAYLVTFRIHAPLSPQSLGRGDDGRLLGMAIRWITLTVG